MIEDKINSFLTEEKKIKNNIFLAAGKQLDDIAIEFGIKRESINGFDGEFFWKWLESDAYLRERILKRFFELNSCKHLLHKIFECHECKKI